MSADLPDHLDPWRAVKAGLAFSGDLALSQLPRVAAIVSGGEGAQSRINYCLRFERDQNRHAIVSGQVCASLRLICQRCLEDVEIAIDIPIRLALLRADQSAETLPEDFDPIVATADSLAPIILIEDEILLAIPAFPRHESGQCQPPSSTRTQSGFADRIETRTTPEMRIDETREAPHPFSVLAAIKNHRSD